MHLVGFIIRIYHDAPASKRQIKFMVNIFLWPCSPTRTQAAPLVRLLDRTQTYTQPVGILWTSDQLVAEPATYKTHNKNQRRTSVHSAGFKTTVPAIKRHPTYASVRTATAIGYNILPFFNSVSIPFAKEIGVTLNIIVESAQLTSIETNTLYDSLLIFT